MAASSVRTDDASDHAAEGSRPALFAPLYGFALMVFFIYRYPIACLTKALERHLNVRS
jgi:polar amino acid transport system permease protein